MDRLFRKRTVSAADHDSPRNTLRNSPSSHDLKPRKDGQLDTGSQKPPRLDVDIRNSLILPGLTQRFSVLLPSLSSHPETSIRTLLASQRARDGPSLTEEEEDLLFAELRGESSLHTSSSSPSLSAPPTGSSSWASSPPPTSTSFSSFGTFGVQNDGAGIKIKSYGFGGSSGLRDDEYIRKVRKNASGRPASPSDAHSPSPIGRMVKPAPVHHKKHSLLEGLSTAQVKRISMALEQIGGELGALQPTLNGVTEIAEEGVGGMVKMEEIPRRTLPPSPRSLNLARIDSSHHVPRPVLTPSRTLPARHTPTASQISTSYTPGQPRPIGSVHRSDGSTSSRVATPNHSRSDSTPSPMRTPIISDRSTSLSRSRSLNQPTSTSESGKTFSVTSTIPEYNEDTYITPFTSNPGTASGPSNDVSTSVGGFSTSRSPPSSCSSGSEEPPSMWEDQGSAWRGEDDDISTLRNLSGIEKAHLAGMQDKLVYRAKAEREALRAIYGDSPMLPHATRLDSLQPISPPTSWRPSSPLHKCSTQQTPSIDASPTHAPEDDPEIRRDFEARIAAATAALNRTPSSRLERKATKRGPMVISSPKLLSSTATLASSPVTPPIDKMSGGKTTSRWKKLGFRRGTSISTPPVTPPVRSPLDEPIPLRPPSGTMDAFRFPTREKPGPSHSSLSPDLALRDTGGAAISTYPEGSNESIAAKGNDDGIPTANRDQSTAPTTTDGPNHKTKSPGGSRAVGGLLRQLSRGKKNADQDRSVVRRTLILTSADAPPLPSPRVNTTRKLSIKRKPLNLTDEDRALVSPTSRQRAGSEASVNGLGFLNHHLTLPTGGDRPSVDGSSTRRSSAGGSLYDLYRDTSTQEFLTSPEEPAVEITEYADGRVVWSVIDALRDEDNPRYSSETSASISSNDVIEVGQSTAELNLRHRDRNAISARPPTNVYYTNSADVADLIDHLSRDLEASRGRIDIHERFTTPRDAGRRMAPPPALNIVASDIQLHVNPPLPNSANTLGSFTSASSGTPTRSVEDRLQALLDRLKDTRT